MLFLGSFAPKNIEKGFKVALGAAMLKINAGKWRFLLGERKNCKKIG